MFDERKDASNIELTQSSSLNNISIPRFSGFNGKSRIKPPPSPESIIELFNSLGNPDTHTFNTLKMIYEYLYFYRTFIPIECLYPFEQLFLSSDFYSHNEEEEDDDDREEQENITEFGLIINIIYELICTPGDYIYFFLKPDDMLKLFEYYNAISKIGDIINIIAEKNSEFIRDYHEAIANIINTPPFTSSKAKLSYFSLKVDSHIISVDSLFNILDNALRSKTDTNLYSMSLEILGLLVNVIPEEIIPNILPVMPAYLIQDGDSVDNLNILELYINMLNAMKSFDGIVNDSFIHLLHEVISKEVDDETKKLVSDILLFDYDLSPFLDYQDFFVSFLTVFSNMPFYMQRSYLIFISRFMKICSGLTIQDFAKADFIKNISCFLEIDDDYLLTASILFIIMSISSCKPGFEWPIEIITAVDDCTLISNEEIAHIAQEVMKQIVHA